MKKITGKDIFPLMVGIAMLHREQNFQGITLNESNLTENGIPIWMECSIYRGDLIHPITVREYFIELKTEHPMLAQKPRRMLRHKTLQKCARLAFGISLPEYNSPCYSKMTTRTSAFSPNINSLSPKKFGGEIEIKCNLIFAKIIINAKPS